MRKMRTFLSQNLIRSNLSQLANRIEALIFHIEELVSLTIGQDNQPSEKLANVISLLEQAHGETLEALQDAKSSLDYSVPEPLPSQAFPANST